MDPAKRFRVYPISKSACVSEGLRVEAVTSTDKKKWDHEEFSHPEQVTEFGGSLSNSSDYFEQVEAVSVSLVDTPNG
jgi:hypothetical protein